MEASLAESQTVSILSVMGRHAEERTGELTAFRRGLHQSLTRWGDALFELCDAVLCGVGPVSSVPSLSLEPEFSRSHGSLYKALAKGRINKDRLRRLLVANRPVDWSAVFAVDASTWARCDAECSPGRDYYYSASKHSAGQPIVAGWSYQWISQSRGNQRRGTVYECPEYETRLLGAQFCEDCRSFMRRLGPGGNCPCCDEPIAFEELVHG